MPLQLPLMFYLFICIHIYFFKYCVLKSGLRNVSRMFQFSLFRTHELLVWECFFIMTLIICAFPRCGMWVERMIKAKQEIQHCGFRAEAGWRWSLGVGRELRGDSKDPQTHGAGQRSLKCSIQCLLGVNNPAQIDFSRYWKDTQVFYLCFVADTGRAGCGECGEPWSGGCCVLPVEEWKTVWRRMCGKDSNQLWDFGI